MRGHEEASGIKYVPPEMFEQWATKDPVNNYEQFLIAENVLTATQVENIKAETKAHIETELKIGSQAKPMEVNTVDELMDVYAPSVVNGQSLAKQYAEVAHEQRITNNEKRFIDGIKEALQQSMIKHPNLIIMGQDIAE